MPRRGPLKYPPTSQNYARPRFDKTGRRWSAPKLVAFIKSKPHWDAFDFKYELRISLEHARYLIVVANRDKVRAWIKDQEVAA